MESFIKKIFFNKPDDKTHWQFVRFGKGSYGGRAALNLHITNRIKFKGSFEYANDFALLAAELANCKFSGIILSKEQLGLSNEKKKSGVYQYETELDSNKVKEIYNKAYCLLLDAEGSGFSLKTKKKLPKPGKSGEAKIDDTFCIIECDLHLLGKIKEGFLWDVGECKKAKVRHTYEILDLVYPKGEKDFNEIRLKTKRKGRLIRKLEVDGTERQVEKEFEA